MFKNASIDSLPLDALVQILCKLNHDELKPVFTVCKFFHDAARLARQLHFDFSTPAPNTSALCGEFEGSPDTPIRQELKKTRKMPILGEEIRRIAVVLFPDGDCKKGLASRPEKISSHQYQRAIHVYHATA